MIIHKPKVMILGAGIFQVPLIKKSQAMGCETFVASTRGNYPGIELADNYFNISTTDISGIVSIAKKNKIDAILTTGTDVSIPTVGAVVDHLGLIGPTLDLALTVSSKTAFRKFLSKNNLNCPAFLKCKDLNSALQYYQDNNNKVVIKPDDASGSRGISILEPHQPEMIFNKSFMYALDHSRNGIVCIEEFIEGTEVGGDAFIINGEMFFFTITHKHMNGVIVRGHSLPGSLPEYDKQRVKNEILSVINKLNYLNGPLNFDVIVGVNKVTVLEIGLRNGGNGITEIIYASYGVDLIKILLDYSLGNDVNIAISDHPRESSSYVFGSENAGIVKSVTPFESLKNKVPEVYEMTLARKIGGHVDTFNNNANLVGYILLNCGFQKYNEICEKINSYLKIEIENE